MMDKPESAMANAMQMIGNKRGKPVKLKTKLPPEPGQPKPGKTEYRQPKLEPQPSECEEMLALVHKRLAPLAKSQADPGRQAPVLFRVGEARRICHVINTFIHP